MLEEQELAVRDARRAGAETAIETHCLGLFLDRVLILLPIHAVRRIGKHVVEFLVLVGVLGERVAEGDLLRVVAGHEHVGLADPEGLAVQFLPEQLDADRGVEIFQRLFGQRQHAARAAGRIVDLADDAAPGELGIVVGDQQIDDQADDFARGKMLTGGFV